VSHRIVCVSRAVGAGGEEVGQLVAERLGFRYVNEEIVAAAAAKAGLDAEAVADTERRRSFIRRLLEGASAGDSVETYAYGGFVAAASSEDLRGVIRETIEEAAAQEDVVIVAHAASFALAGRPDVLRVFVTAPAPMRAERLGQAEGIETKDAAKAIKDSDKARADYLRRFYEIDHELPTHYDLVVSTDALSVEQAAEIVVAAASV
jgi:cytidylate kinase